MAFRRVQNWNRFKQFGDTIRKTLHTSGKIFADDKSKSTKHCDPGLCPRNQMDMKQMLDRKEMDHLQPARSKFSVETFSISRPHVPPVVDPTLDEMCLEKKKCDEMKKGGDSGKKKKDGGK